MPFLQGPVRAVVAGHPGAAATDADQQLVGPGRVRADRVDARRVVAAAEPFGAAGLVPQWLVQLPRFAAIDRAEQAAGQGAGPDRVARCTTASLNRPDLDQLPGHATGRLTGGLLWVDRRGHFMPADAGIVRRVQLDAEVTEVQRRLHAAARQGLQHMHFAVELQRVGEHRAFHAAPAVDEGDDIGAQVALVIEHIPSAGAGSGRRPLRAQRTAWQPARSVRALP